MCYIDSAELYLLRRFSDCFLSFTEAVFITAYAGWRSVVAINAGINNERDTKHQFTMHQLPAQKPWMPHSLSHNKTKTVIAFTITDRNFDTSTTNITPPNQRYHDSVTAITLTAYKQLRPVAFASPADRSFQPDQPDWSVPLKDHIANLIN
ncbi:unnamed protein product [Caenorhabditis auriculariae]|uniref:Uncharacterized protein n=1 Tax=Caenorhabditis auriculariae TaxID=2777116 RepID=A0A8S1H1U6_9PELO|nr:unnamed protein product [Caenorhabditis auriculariae]